MVSEALPTKGTARHEITAPGPCTSGQEALPLQSVSVMTASFDQGCDMFGAACAAERMAAERLRLRDRGDVKLHALRSALREVRREIEAENRRQRISCGRPAPVRLADRGRAARGHHLTTLAPPQS